MNFSVLGMPGLGCPTPLLSRGGRGQQRGGAWLIHDLTRASAEEGLSDTCFSDATGTSPRGPHPAQHGGGVSEERPAMYLLVTLGQRPLSGPQFPYPVMWVCPGLEANFCSSGRETSKFVTLTSPACRGLGRWTRGADAEDCKGKTASAMDLGRTARRHPPGRAEQRAVGSSGDASPGAWRRSGCPGGPWAPCPEHGNAEGPGDQWRALGVRAADRWPALG